MMIGQDTTIPSSLKCFLGLLAVIFASAAIVLVISLTSATTSTGSTPALAITLAKGANTGILGPGTQRWFKFTSGQPGQTSPVEQALTLIFTPDDGQRVKQVSLHLFEENQALLFYQGKASQMTQMGVGQIVSRDHNPETGELFWTGQLNGPKSYYVQLTNGSEVAIDYWFFPGDVFSYPLTDLGAAPAVAIAEMGSDPGQPAPLMPGVTQARLKPHSTRWYAFTHVDATNPDKFTGLNFTMFFTPDDGQRRHQVNFELFPASEMERWRRGDWRQLTHFGAGMLVSRDGSEQTGERMWAGTVIQGDTYLLAVENETEVEVDYWLFDGDIYRPELDQVGPPPAPALAQGASPQTAVPLQVDRLKGSLNPGQEVWYSFSINDLDGEYFEEMAFTMITTPDDGQRIQQMSFDIFTAQGVQNWSPGNSAQIHNVGAGSIVYRDNNPLTGERFWSGWVIENDLYYLRIRNSSAAPMDYWLFRGDVYQPNLDL